MATALYKLPYTIVFAFTLIYLTFLDRFCQYCLNNNLMCYMQISPCLPSALTHTQPSSLTAANCTGICHAVSLHKRCCFAFRQKRFDFLEFEEKKTLLLWHLKIIVSTGIPHTPRLHSLLHLQAELSAALQKARQRELRNAKPLNKAEGFCPLLSRLSS